ncbi:MAG: helix-turn-helix transcriptional regulator [Cyclobacteriaceae bacterium]|nr:helix-turn-helix transcriptional regulator [Cyclobacteriaceae bacterium]UYN85974.1 MAG: helix-turn-helix transcriptional regulator [Cyclobacteriaceae bacterium]
MNYEEIKTNGYLSSFVKCFWTFETSTQAVEHTILPDGYFDLLVEIKNEKVFKIKLTGIWTIPVDIKTEKYTKIFAIRFKPLATICFEFVNFKTLLNSSMVLTNNFLELDTLPLGNFASFCQQMTNNLEKKILLTKPVCKRRILLFEQIFQKTTYNVKELATKSYLTSRQINRFFNSDYGLSLKTYIDIIRCNETFKSIVKNDLNPQSEYFDQAHFIKEVKKFTGVTPKKLSQNKNDRFLQLLTLKAI